MNQGFQLRTVLVLPFVLQVLAAVGLTGYLALYNGQQAVNDVAGQLRQEVTARVQDALSNYLQIPPRVNQLHASALVSGALDLDDASNREQHFLRYLRTYPEVSNTYIGTPSGELFGAREIGAGVLQITVKDQQTDGALHYYNITGAATRSGLHRAVAQYDPRLRPWYQAAVEAGKATWSDIFVDAGTNGLAITAATPVYSAAPELLGVLGTALRLSWIENFLADLKIGRNGQVFILEKSTGNLVATSQHDNLTASTRAPQNNSRLLATASSNTVVRETAKYLQTKFVDFSNINNVTQLEYKLNEARQFIQIAPSGEGLDWLIVVVVPEADFMQRIQHNTQITIMLCCLALIIALLVGFLTTRWIAKPLLQLNAGAKALASGEWEFKSPDILERQDEVGQLAQSFCIMAGQLKSAFENLEEKVRERTRDLAEKNEQLVYLNQEKNEFLGIAAHDLKNPLSAIKGLAEEIEEAFDDMEADEVVEYAQKIRQASQKMFGLITNLLDVNAIESGKMNVELSNVDIQPIVANLTQHYSRPAEAKGIKIHFESPQTSYVAYVDENTAHQILDNLISNAVKYSPPNKDVFVRLLHRDDKIRCEIQDQGPGLSEEDKQKLFGKFNRLTAKPTGGEHSTGLGLFIVKKLIEAMHGDVWCESTLGHGACFIVELPVATA
jgi:signal transduction histidine kinase